MLRKCGCSGCYYQGLEEDIKILEDLAKILDKTCESGKSSTSIRNLIKGYRDLQYKLKEKICFEGHSQFEDLKKNSVSKDRIREKIDIYQNRKFSCDDLELKVRLDVKIKAYKELLEEDYE